MRTWRKLYSKVLDSEQIGELSDGAYCLLMMLITAQDDTGFYPWSATKVRRLIAARPNWTEGQATTYAEELVSQGIVSWQPGGILLTEGQALNGKPKEGHTGDDLYSRPGCALATPELLDTISREQDGMTTGEEREIPGQIKIRLDKSRVEKSKSRGDVEEKAAAAEKTETSETDDQFLERMGGRFPELSIAEELEACQLWCEGKKKPKPPNLAGRLRFLNWLKRSEAKRVEEGNGARGFNPLALGGKPPTVKYTAAKCSDCGASIYGRLEFHAERCPARREGWAALKGASP